MIQETARLLAEELRNSAEYRAYAEAKERAEANETTRALLAEYGRLQLAAQAAAVSGRRDDETLQKLQKLGELLQFDGNASACILAEYRLKQLLGEVYKTLANAVDVDLGALEA